jgi:hypothetical protein
MLTYTGSRNLYGKLTNNESSANLTLGDSLINAETRRILRKLGNKLIERTSTDTTETNVQYYPRPARMKKLKTVTATVGTTKYTVNESPNRKHWDQLNQNTAYTSSIPEWFYQRANDIGFWPIPSGTAVTLTYTFEIVQKDLSVADYTTGTISTATSGTTTIVGTSTSWTVQMVGRYLNITETNTVNTGDSEWYEIASRQNGTTIILQRNYEGNSISGGTAAYTIGQVSLLPDGYHELPVYRATQIYYSKIDQVRSDKFKALADDLESTLFADAGNDSTDIIVAETSESETTNPNLQITL